MFIDWSTTMNKAHNVTILTVAGAREYNLTLQFHYSDTIAGDPVLQKHYIEFPIADQKSSNLNGGEKLIFSFFPDDVFGTVNGGIQKIGDPGSFYGRKATHIDFVVTAGAQDFSDFLQVSAPSTSVAQDKPTYSNIDGGYGIFSSKSVRIFRKGIWNGFLDFMSANKPLCSLRFKNSGNAISTSCN
jgi:hypothetical protein